jgi:hypothetical protein
MIDEYQHNHWIKETRHFRVHTGWVYLCKTAGNVYQSTVIENLPVVECVGMEEVLNGERREDKIYKRTWEIVLCWQSQ